MYFPQLAFVAALIASVSANINTPTALIECQPVALSWSATTSPYYLSVLPGGQSSATALEQLGTVTSGTTYTWTVNLASGTNVTIALTDGTGAVYYTSAVVIQAGTSTSCLTSSSSASASGSSGSSGTSASASASGSTAAASGSASASHSATASASSSSSSKASGAQQVAKIGAFTVAGAALIAAMFL